MSMYLPFRVSRAGAIIAVSTVRDWTEMISLQVWDVSLKLACKQKPMYSDIGKVNPEDNQGAMWPEEVEVIGEITEIKIIVVGRSIRELDRLQRKYGRGRWRKIKALATVRLPDDTA